MKPYDDIAFEASALEQPEPSSPVRSALTQVCAGLGELADRYDVFLVDQWGVLHDGHRPFPGVLQCLRRLAQAGKRVIIISNSGKRAACNAVRLDALGFPRNRYTQLVSSGEIAWQMLAAGRGVFRSLRRTPCLLLASDAAETFADGLATPLVARVEAAGFILLAGVDDTRPPAFYQAMMREGVARQLPLICINPDLTRMTSAGLQPGAGALAREYQAAGGKVYFIGKPYPEIYQHCLHLAQDAPLSRVLAVGDSLHHDVAGGLSAGLDTLLTLEGVHRDHFVDTRDAAEINQRIQRIAGPLGAIPDFAAPAFRW